MAAEADALKNMVLSFRVSELQMLLGFAGRNKSGRKTELQARAVELLRLRSVPIQMKIKELYKSIQQGLASGNGTVPLSQPLPSSSTTSSSTLTNTMQQQPQHPQQQQQQQQPQQRSSMVFNPSAYPNNPQHRTIYSSGMYHHPYPTKLLPSAPNYPIHPDVRLKSLPFSELQAELIKPSSLVPHNSQRPQESTFVFHLTPQQATDIAINRDFYLGARSDFAIQVQLRFCMLETSCPQDDCFPPGIAVKVNNKSFPLPNPIPTNKPGVEPKRPPRPLNITPYVKLSPTVANNVTVAWTAEFGRGYVLAIYLVRKLTSTDLLQKLHKKGARHADFTRGLIKEKLNEDADCEIATTSLRVSLICPLGKMRMTTPCRASTCQHLQCFDASLYLQMNEKKPTWNCPVCDKPALYDNIVIDGYFQQVLTSSKPPLEGNEIQLHQDGTWSSMAVKQEKAEMLTPMSDRVSSRIETLSDDLEVLPLPNESEVVMASAPGSGNEEQKKNQENATVIDLTISDSDDESEVVGKATTVSKPDSTEKKHSAAPSSTYSSCQPQSPVSSHPQSGSVFRKRRNSMRTLRPRSLVQVPVTRSYRNASQENRNTHKDTTSVSSSSSGGSTSNAGGSVSSSGYVSPSIITLDSPSPPATPVPEPAPGLPMPPPPVYYPMSFLDLDSDSNSPGHPSSLFPRY